MLYQMNITVMQLTKDRREVASDLYWLCIIVVIEIQVSIYWALKAFLTVSILPVVVGVESSHLKGTDPVMCSTK